MTAIPNGQTERPPSLVVDQFDWEIIQFVVSWAYYGGPKDEDTIPLFGMDAQRLLGRFDNVILRLRRGGEHATLTLKQYRLFQRATALVSSLGEAKQGSGTAKPDRSSTLELSASAGRWSQHHGVWHWQEAESPHSTR